eukprot:1190711-Prorocentrum_minimum.AAC.2
MEGTDEDQQKARVLLVGATNRPNELDEAARRCAGEPRRAHRGTPPDTENPDRRGMEGGSEESRRAAR